MKADWRLVCLNESFKSGNVAWVNVNGITIKIYIKKCVDIKRGRFLMIKKLITVNWFYFQHMNNYEKF